MIRTYSELSLFSSLEDRFRYLALRGGVAHATFGHDRWMNQKFYASRAWKDVKGYVIVRDEACDLGVPGFTIYSNLVVHHMNPITVEDIREGNEDILDPEFLITTTHKTHNAIHYGDESLLPQGLVERTPYDHAPWRQ